MEYAQANPAKMNLIRSAAKGNLADLCNFLTFIKLPIETLTTITQFKSDDWYAYGNLREYECFDNRTPEDLPYDVSKGSEYLTEYQFNKFNLSKTITYKLYIDMRKEQDSGEI